MSELSKAENRKVGFVLGLTGGIATGKSTAAKVFQSHRFPLIDGDVIARETVEPGTLALRKVVSVFGQEILQSDGQLDRGKLGMIVFPSKEKRQKLDQLLDPFIRKAIKDQIAYLSSHHPLVIVDIPLLYEGHYDHYMDAVAVVYTTPDIQLRRLMKRNQLTLEQAQQRISSQLPIEEKKQRADILFDNNGTKEELVEQIENWLSANRFL
ncbi:dephospho-CoA kinase [Enterococcus faecium]|nr:dephospho-CoA kinase [Enterococcus faecium]